MHVWKTLAASCLAVALTPAAAAVARTPADVPDFAALHLNGTAKVATVHPSGNRVLRLTGGGFRQAGSAWAADPIDVTRSFHTTFEAHLHHGASGADGIAFVLQTAGPRALGGWGGGLGYRGLHGSLAVEFDDHRNERDPDADHVALVLNGNPDYHAAQAPAGTPLFGRPFEAHVAYDAAAGRLTVHLGHRQLLDQRVNLAEHLGSDTAWAGFTGATGERISKQDIRYWTLTSQDTTAAPEG
ncbi:L-type lectin-domain containing protein [Actinoplanes sp. DH11]|uniref:L-type lectin-domain containing protein n=1 Tax=Actinoplanes sp. DH11 TaxID=2857011 RepID=UPI001E40BB3B|nr:L-type lectin-domain containing protein [Actinoplanes sp. DH11]